MVKKKNPFWYRMIITNALAKRGDQQAGEVTYSNYVLAKSWREWKITAISHLKGMVWITVGIFSAAFGLKGFLLTNEFIYGGATGISLLISAITDIPLHYLIIGINIPFVFMGYKIVSRAFAVKTGIAITGLALVLAYMNFPDVTKDNLLVALFGGFFLGAGIGLSVRGGAVIDGTEVLAIYLSRKLGSTIGDIIVLINIIIFSAAAYFLTIEIALYSMITYLAASKTLDFIIEGIEEYTGVTIISTHAADIQEMIVTNLGRGVTVYSGKRGHGKAGVTREQDIVYTVVTRLELSRLNTEIMKIDPNAFVVMSSVKDIRGGLIKKRPLKNS